jgi:hypothetical protein
MKENQYIDHEVRIRINEERFEKMVDHEVKLRLHDDKFSSHEKEMKRIDNKLNLIITVTFTSALLPIILHWLKLA